MVGKQITYYLKGNLNEREAIDLWKQLLSQPELIELLEIELYLYIIFQEANYS